MKLHTIQTITLDFTVPQIKNIRCIENDLNSRTVKISVTDNGLPFPLNPDTMTACYKIHKPDHRFIYNEVPIDPDGGVTIRLTDQAMAIPGIARCELQIFTKDKKNILSTMPFSIIVEKSVVTDKDIATSNESNVLLGMMQHMADRQNPHQTTKEQVGLGNADNTSDLDKPVSNAARRELDRLNSELDKKADKSSLHKVATSGSYDDLSDKPPVPFFGVCNTAQGTAAKTVSCPGFTPIDGARILILFGQGNTSRYMTLNINNTGAYFAWFQIGCSRSYNDNAISELIAPGCVYEFIYQSGSTPKWMYCGPVPVTGIRGAKESSYRHGNVTLTPADIGALAKSGDTVSGDLTITGNIIMPSADAMIYGRDSRETGHDHALQIGHSNQNYWNFYEYGGIFNFYKSVNNNDLLLGRITENGWEGKITLPEPVSIFGHRYSGSNNLEGQPIVYGTYNPSPAGRFGSSGIQIRENELVGNTKTDIGYAPSIGFHWLNRRAATLLFDADDGKFKFRNQDGISRATLEANLDGSVSTEAASGDVGITAKRTDTNVSLFVGVGSGGTRHGIFSEKLGKWIAYADDSGVKLNGNADTATKASQDGNGRVIANTYLPLSGGTLSGSLYFDNGGAGSGIRKGGNDTYGLANYNNLDLYSWYGISFSTTISGNPCSGKPAVSIDTRKGNMYVYDTLSAGNLKLRKGTSNYGSKLNFGDGEYVYLYEDSDDHLLISSTRKGIDLSGGDSIHLNAKYIRSRSGDTLEFFGTKNIADTPVPVNVWDGSDNGNGKRPIYGDGAICADMLDSGVIKYYACGSSYSHEFMSYNNSGAYEGCVRLTDDTIYCGKIHTTSGDYAECWEYLDGNINKEDRVGHFVTFIKSKIRISSKGDPISKIGVVSGSPSVIGDSDTREWKHKYLTDIYGRYLHDENGELLLNPAYNSSLQYIPRINRPEWDAVGTHGKLVVIDDGTCEEDGFCLPTDGGIATAADEGFYVSERLDKNHIRIYMK